MSTLNQIRHILIEMAMPTEDVRNMTFYHGYTPRQINLDGKWGRGEDIGNEIATGGIIKAPTEKRKGALAPVHGRAYVTHDVGYAQMYAIGGDIAGGKYRDGDSKYGYMFKIKGHALGHDIQPDEDSIGKMIGENKGPTWLHRMADYHVAPSRIKTAKSGEYSMYARIGKQLVTKMTPEQKIELITKHGAHVANIGDMEIHEAYRINKQEHQHKLKRDGSNFFDYAERIA